MATPSLYQFERNRSPVTRTAVGSPLQIPWNPEIIFPVVLSGTRDSSAHCSGSIVTISPWVLPLGCTSPLGCPIVLSLSFFSPLWEEDATFPLGFSLTSPDSIYVILPRQAFLPVILLKHAYCIPEQSNPTAKGSSPQVTLPIDDTTKHRS